MIEQLFPVEKSTVDLTASNFQANRQAWEPVLQEFDSYLKDVSSEGDEASTLRHQTRHQLLPRDRIALLLDADSPFLELGCFAGFRVSGSNSCANIIAGIGLVRVEELGMK
ncbi:methylcrotonoyl-CoA carboxylase beta chain [Colletotrichum lupini]|uniref:Methylcrotonoyl-CoA carboxylase beta chain n=1 Tax=Colletotrichum lupini TaxID=145971 RepID=A0A9Q8WMP7_9PEZI|nr:methylcrotonoyl-CoA carboxylase beta chain [Colletotrichum lupini]UQC88295.1 methylcrotonoyl-CoA carboxylase beta chain [Colletotrichum lupini]